MAPFTPVGSPEVFLVSRVKSIGEAPPAPVPVWTRLFIVSRVRNCGVEVDPRVKPEVEESLVLIAEVWIAPPKKLVLLPTISLSV